MVKIFLTKNITFSEKLFVNELLQLKVMSNMNGLSMKAIFMVPNINMHIDYYTNIWINFRCMILTSTAKEPMLYRRGVCYQSTSVDIFPALHKVE
jgi:hypothetical protein